MQHTVDAMDLSALATLRVCSASARSVAIQLLLPARPHHAQTYELPDPEPDLEFKMLDEMRAMGHVPQRPVPARPVPQALKHRAATSGAVTAAEAGEAVAAQAQQRKQQQRPAVPSRHVTTSYHAGAPALAYLFACWNQCTSVAASMLAPGRRDASSQRAQSMSCRPVH